MISTSPKKEKEAREALGADHFVVSKDEAQMSASYTHTMCILLGGCPLELKAECRSTAMYATCCQHTLLWMIEKPLDD